VTTVDVTRRARTTPPLPVRPKKVGCSQGSFTIPISPYISWTWFEPESDLERYAAGRGGDREARPAPGRAAAAPTAVSNLRGRDTAAAELALAIRRGTPTLAAIRWHGRCSWPGFDETECRTLVPDERRCCLWILGASFPRRRGRGRSGNWERGSWRERGSWDGWQCRFDWRSGLVCLGRVDEFWRRGGLGWFRWYRGHWRPHRFRWKGRRDGYRRQGWLTGDGRCRGRGLSLSGGSRPRSLVHHRSRLFRGRARHQLLRSDALRGLPRVRTSALSNSGGRV
jgi:hypothetical protein